MKRHRGNTDPTLTPSYLPDWPQRWPATPAEASRTVENMYPHASAGRAIHRTLYAAVTVAAIWAVLTLHPFVSVPLVVGAAAGITGGQERHRRRRERARRRNHT